VVSLYGPGKSTLSRSGPTLHYRVNRAVVAIASTDAPPTVRAASLILEVGWNCLFIMPTACYIAHPTTDLTNLEESHNEENDWLFGHFGHDCSTVLS